MEFEINRIFRQFNKPGKMLEYEPIKSGHINHTFYVGTDSGDRYILQRINHNVFRDPEGVINNKIKVAHHIAGKRAHLGPEELSRRVLAFYRTHNGSHLLKDEGGNYWNLMRFIEDSRVYLRTPNAKVAHEAGKAFAGFLRDTEDLDPDSLVETIPRFHSMSLRFDQFDESLGRANSKRLRQAEEQIGFANSLRDEMRSLENRVLGGGIPLRVTHNDTKISNALFAEDDEALCVIDLDTVMKGVVHYDFGDAVRTICNTGEEDEKDLSRVGFEMEYFRAFAKGFLGQSGLVLRGEEIEGLAFSSKVMTFIVGLRMLTDFLNNDVYFDTAYETHNLVRAKSQFRLAELIGERLPEMEEIVRSEAR